MEQRLAAGCWLSPWDGDGCASLVRVERLAGGVCHCGTGQWASAEAKHKVPTQVRRYLLFATSTSVLCGAR